MRRVLRLMCAVAVVGIATPALANEDAHFKKRFLALKAKQNGPVLIKMKATEDPTKLPVKMTQGATLVSGARTGIYTPPLLTDADMIGVVNQHMVDVRKCYKKQLAADPEWSDDLIVDLAVKKTGRVAEVSVAPSRVKKDVIGQCLMSMIPRWKFPEFTGETDDGITQEVVNASVPFSFSAQ